LIELLVFCVVVLVWVVVDLQAAATLVSLPAASQHMGYTATGSQLRSTLISFTYCIFLST